MSQDCLPAILNKMVRVFADDYDSLFRVVYEDAIQMVGALPIEPGEEIRNAFDHFALASRFAAEVDGAPIPPPPETETTRERAWTNIEQARRHIVMGRYYCLEHQLNFQIASIAYFVRRLDTTVDATLATFQARVAELEARLPGAKAITVLPSTDRAMILDQIRDMESKISEITNLLNDYLRLYRDVREAIDGSRRSH